MPLCASPAIRRVSRRPVRQSGDAVGERPLQLALRKLMPAPSMYADRLPPGPFRPTFWRSPLRGPWLTSVLGLALLVTIPIDRDHRLSLQRRLQPPARRQLGRAPARPARLLPVLLAGASVVAVRGHPGIARDARAGGDPDPAGQAVVGHPAAVRVAGRAQIPRTRRAAVARPARRRSAVRVRHGHPQHPVRLPVQVLLHRRPLLRRLGVHRRVRLSRGDQALHDALARSRPGAGCVCCATIAPTPASSPGSPSPAS